MSKYISVSIEGGKPVRDALAVIARKRGVTIGKLVGEAVQKDLGHELDTLVNFFADSGTTTVSIDRNKSAKGA